ncbi:MAG TPA: hypothetical protein VHO72_18010 [Bacteroidales bacterium]|nr:hypothetical protein [Bacteroidales bacterium]
MKTTAKAGIYILCILFYLPGIAQINSHITNRRIIQSHYYELSSKPKYQYDYLYDNKGNLLSVTKKRQKDNEWIATESQQYTYGENGLVVCNYIRGNKLKRDVDTFLIENGKVLFLSQFRAKNYNDYLYRSYYTYQNGNLHSITKETFVFIESYENAKKEIHVRKTDEFMSLTFVYQNNQIKSVIDIATGYTLKWIFEWKNGLLEAIKVYNTKEDKLAQRYEIKSLQNRIKEVVSYISNEPAIIYSKTYGYDEYGNLKLSQLNDDSGWFRDEYKYESGNGNAALFIEKLSVFDYIRPEIQ